MPYVEVDIDLKDLDDEDLIYELQGRGYDVVSGAQSELCEQEITWICDAILSQDLDRSDMIAKSIYEKLRKK